jgi:ACS family D-galactonate transporter-like MFS transporter
MGSFGWRALFISVGAVGVLFALVWWRCYREPHEDKHLSQQEREHIVNGGGLCGERPADGFSWPLVRQLLGNGRFSAPASASLPAIRCWCFS